MNDDSEFKKGDLVRYARAKFWARRDGGWPTSLVGIVLEVARRQSRAAQPHKKRYKVYFTGWKKMYWIPRVELESFRNEQ